MSHLDCLDNFPKIRRRLALDEFAEELRGNYVNVWVNLSDDFNDRHLDYQVRVEELRALIDKSNDADRTDEESAEFAVEIRRRTDEIEELGHKLHADLWGVPVEQVRKMYEVSPELYRWVARGAWEKVSDYRSDRKKGTAS